MTYQATILDAGVGNLGNLKRALEHVGAGCEITTDPDAVRAGRCLLLPGVGAFKPPRERLRGELEAALREALDDGAWLLGICVGFQLLFEGSSEFGATDGLGLLPGKIERLPDGVPRPHIGWNRLHGGLMTGSKPVGGTPEDGAQPNPKGGRRPFEHRPQGVPPTGIPGAGHPLLDGVEPGSYVYFVHSFAPIDTPAEIRLAEATHGASFAAVAGRGRVLGTQFHPEKSGHTGLRILENYLEIAHAADSGD